MMIYKKTYKRIFVDTPATPMTLYTDKMEFHVLELPKLPTEFKDDSDNILLWAKFINAERKEKFDMVATKDPYIESAYQKLQIISQDKQKRLEYEAREKAIRNHNQFMYEAEQRGWKTGKAEGKLEGKLEASLAIAKNLLDSGISKEIVIQSTGLSLAQIEQL